MVSVPSRAHLLTLEQLLAISVSDLTSALTEASDLVADALHADKVDSFVYDAQRDTLVAVGTSRQPLSALQKRLGLDVLPVSNGGRTVEVFTTGRSFSGGHMEQDAEELRGIRDALKVRSEIGVALDVGGKRRGVLMLASLANDQWNEDDVRFAESVARWVSSVLHQAELVEEIKRAGVAAGRKRVAEELVTIVAHDLRNLLFPIDLLLQLIEGRAQRDQRDEDIRDSTKARRGVAHLDALVNDILDVARLEQGALFIEPRTAAIVPIVEAVARVLRTPAKPIDVKANGEILAVVDPARIRQCLENLIANAVKHSPKDTPVLVTVDQVVIEGSALARIEVIDKGPGVAADILPFIFERFVTSPQSNRRAGLGLGLFLARQIALLHGGDLAVESTVGEGARFMLSLPLADLGSLRP